MGMDFPSSCKRQSSFPRILIEGVPWWEILSCVPGKERAICRTRSKSAGSKESSMSIPRHLGADRPIIAGKVQEGPPFVRVPFFLDRGLDGLTARFDGPLVSGRGIGHVQVQHGLVGRVLFVAA